jgi:cytochrome c peroxidase
LLRWVKQSLFVLIPLFWVACKKDAPIQKQEIGLESIIIPDGFPPIEFPADNAFTKERWLLGKALFYEKQLSLDSSVSCASCHSQQFGFSDNVALSKGFKQRLGNRNSPSIINVAYHPYFTREGGVPSLEMQVLVPIQEHNEFNNNILDIAKRLSSNQNLQNLSFLAYNRPLDFYVIPRALATFERSLISGNSKFDQYKKGTISLTEEEQKGMNLFFSDRTNCSDCHSGFNFTNYQFENNGLYETYNDPGRKRLTGLDSDLAKFKVPSLRNIEVTAPYMYDGSLPDLEAVINHYNSGGKQHPNKSEKIKSLQLSQDEKKQIIAFLKTLTDVSFLNQTIFKP